MTSLDGVNGTVCNAQQYALSLPSQDNPIPLISCLTYGQAISMALSNEVSFLSLVAVISIFILIGWNVRWCRRYATGSDWKLFRGPADIYMLSLLIFDILQATGDILSVRWVHNGIVTTGTYCTIQGIIQQFGELGVALITLIIAVHTFVAALWRKGLQARGFALIVVGLVVLFCSLWVGIGSGVHTDYEIPTPYWCWISPQFPGERLAGEYVWMWIALFASVILYIPLHFWVTGHFLVDPEKWYKFQLRGLAEAAEYEQRRAALGMLLYPFAYSIVILPLTIARWSQFDHSHVPEGATFFAGAIFNLSGAINVLLLLIVRPQLLLLTRPERTIQPETGIIPQGTGSAVSAYTPNLQLGPDPSATPLADVLSSVDSRSVV